MRLLATASAVSVIGSAAAAVSYVLRLRTALREEQQRRAEAEVAREKAEDNRAAERRGRIAAERNLREHTTARMATEGVSMRPIGYVDSCFRDRRGTPRQGLLAPSVRARVRFEPTLVQAPSLEALEQFSHVWVVFVFHQNTNIDKGRKLGGGGGGGRGSGNKTVPAKVAPPRLDGAKVGLFSTRTPSRPNPIGLSVVRLDGIDLSGGFLSISGHDLVDGTPVLDVKVRVARCLLCCCL